jgi:ATP-dependent Lon protease
VEHGNPLILLDEIDKMSNDFRGDPSAAMLEVLDPEQNATFQDHYLEVEYDLSKVMFFTTANSLHSIPRPLLDRMEVISIEGYIDSEKLHIAKKYLLPKQLQQHGLAPYKIQVPDAVIKDIVQFYTREAGVRNLERQLANVCRKIAKEIVREEEIERHMKNNQKKPTRSQVSKAGIKKTYTITSKKLVEMLGPHKFRHGKVEEENEIGLTNGMAYTEVGGDLLPIEVTVVPGKGKFTVTGQLGDVMKESCSAAMSYVRSRGPLFGLDKDFFFNIDVHIHVPEGAIPKDGPSAGCAITTSIVSAVTKTPVLRTVAMTGEITLRGRVLAIGGVKEKILSAYRGGIRTVILPKENDKDLKDIPEEVIKDLKIVLVDHVDQVLVHALEIRNAKDLFKSTKDANLGLRAQYTGHSYH